MPPKEAVVVHGWRDGEENALRIAGALSQSLAADVPLTLLCEVPEESRQYADIALEQTAWAPHRVRFVRKNSFRGLRAFLRARVAFSTHGLWGNPAPGSRRLHVLLGHGHGPKGASDPNNPFVHRAQLATTNNAVWGGAVIADQNIAPENTAVTGNPRDDAFSEKTDRARLAALGIDPALPFVLWLPTFRTPRYNRMYAQLPEAVDNARLQKRIGRMRDAAESLGITIVTKAHQLDDQANAERWGMKSITNESLLDARLSFFQLLSLADGLVSDYSSVWVDYLRTQRPTGLLLIDEDEFARGRGFNSPSIEAVADHLVLKTNSDADEFMARVRTQFDDQGCLDKGSAETADRLQLRRDPGATQRVLEATERALSARGLPPIRGLQP